MAKRQYMFEPLLLKVENPSDIFEKYRLELAKKLVEAISYCVKTNLPNIIFVEIETITPISTLQLRVDKSTFLDSLEKNLITLEQYEEYEICAEIMKLKEKIIKNSTKKRSYNKKDKAVADLINTLKNL
jgi:hypothetical protein